MAGGLIQLAAYGSENMYLMGNPQITFFKLVYKHHTNFSIESVEVQFEGHSSIPEVSQSPTQLKVKVPRVGDLLHNIYLKVQLPNILSSNKKQFQWVKHLGEAIIQSVSYSIGGQVIEQFSGEWIHIYHQTSLNESQKSLYNQMTGNTPDLYQPSNYYDIEKEVNREKGLYPSILGRYLYIPIPFSFTRNVGLSLPLLALQYHDVEITIEINPLVQLYTIYTSDICNKTTKRRQPNPLKPDHKLSYFTYQDKVKNSLSQFYNTTIFKETTLLDDEMDIQKQYNNPNYCFQCSLEMFYIFLDEKERKSFTEMSHEYLIEQVSCVAGSGYAGQNNRIEMSLYNPTKEFYWLFSRDDLFKYNIHFNYTNLINPQKSYDAQYGDDNEFTPDLQKISLTPDTWRHLTPSILQRAKLQFNSHDRIEYKDPTYFNYLIPFQHHSSVHPGIYNYSFSLNPEKYQPSGSVNLSMIGKVVLDFDTITPPIDPEIQKVLKSQYKAGDKCLINSYGIEYDEDTDNVYVKDKQIYQYTYNLHIYAVNYNILKIVGGMGGMAYTK